MSKDCSNVKLCLKPNIIGSISNKINETLQCKYKQKEIGKLVKLKITMCKNIGIKIILNRRGIKNLPRRK